MIVTEELTPSWRTYFISILIFTIIGFVGGAATLHWYETSDLKAEIAKLTAQLKAEKEKPPVIKESVKVQTVTQWAYGGEKIIYRDAQGKEIPVDMAYQFNKPEFIFTVNGKIAKFEKMDNERFVFDKNMGKMTQDTTANINIIVPTIDKTKHIGIGAVVSNKGSAPLLEYSNKNYEVGIFGVPDFYGIKGTYRF